jgi:hypothetical protein
MLAFDSISPDIGQDGMSWGTGDVVSFLAYAMSEAIPAT